MDAREYHGVTRLFYDADDVKDVSAADALRHALAAQRILGLMLAGLFDPRESINTGDDELLEEVAWRGRSWTQKATDVLAAERAQCRAKAEGAKS